jgi:membrane-bound lytic murein transglycosylase D
MRPARGHTIDIRKWPGKVLLALLAGMICLLLEVALKNTRYSTEDTETRIILSKDYQKFGLFIPRDLNFAGESLPLERPDVLEKMRKELFSKAYHQTQWMVFMARSAAWFPIIEPILKRNGVPDDIKYIALVESNLTNAVSPKGATGFWQFVESSGLKYGLEIGGNIDERYNVERSTEAACQYFKDAYKMFGSWTLAAASFNLGMGGIEKELKQQNGKTLFDLSLNSETSSYIFKLIAIKEILSKPKHYGFLVSRNRFPGPIRTNYIKINTAIPDLLEFDIVNGWPVGTTRYFNPWITGNTLPNDSARTYRIKIPDKSCSQDFLISLISLAPVKDSLPPPLPDSLKIGNFALPDSLRGTQ